jgi:hypothetical protein
LIGVIGGYGAVGSVAVRCLAAEGFRLRAGGRSPARGAALAEVVPGVTAAVVDATDADSVARFAADCDVVLNCAGPAYQLGETPRRAVIGAGAHYVDVMDGSAAAFAPPAGRVAVSSAGLLPGLSGMLPHLLADGLAEPCFTGHYVGLDRFTFTGAVDYLLSMERDYGTALAVWRDGRVVPGALGVEEGCSVLGTPRPVTAHPYLTAELVRQAARLGLKEARWYNAFDGEHVLRVLNRHRAPGGLTTPEESAAALVRASALDLSGRAPYHLLRGTVDGWTAAGDLVRRTLLVRGRDGNALTGVVGAVAAAEVARGAVAPGCHEAVDVVAAGTVLDALRRHLPDTVVWFSATAREAGVVAEEGVL